MTQMNKPETMGPLLKVALETILNPTTQKTSEVCCICGNGVELPPDSPRRFENSANLRCDPCLESERQQAELGKGVERERAKAETLSQIPTAFQSTKRAKLPQPERLDAALRWAYGAKGLLLYGSTGCGKSRIVWEVAKREVLAGKTLKSVSAYELTRYPSLFMSGDDAAVKFSDSLVKVDLLILDDVFKAKPTERVEELLFAVIDERGSWERPCLITLNDTGDSLTPRLSTDRGPALIRRLREHCIPIRFA